MKRELGQYQYGHQYGKKFGLNEKSPAYQVVFTLVYTENNFLGKNVAKADILLNQLPG